MDRKIYGHADSLIKRQMYAFICRYRDRQIDKQIDNVNIKIKWKQTFMEFIRI